MIDRCSISLGVVDAKAARAVECFFTETARSSGCFTLYIRSVVGLTEGRCWVALTAQFDDFGRFRTPSDMPLNGYMTSHTTGVASASLGCLDSSPVTPLCSRSEGCLTTSSVSCPGSRWRVAGSRGVVLLKGAAAIRGRWTGRGSYTASVSNGLIGGRCCVVLLNAKDGTFLDV